MYDYTYGVPNWAVIKSALGCMAIVSTSDFQKHLRGPNRFQTDGMHSGVTYLRSWMIGTQLIPFNIQNTHHEDVNSNFKMFS